MKKYYILSTMLLLSLTCAAQFPEQEAAPDSLKEFRYQRRGNLFPFDSGVAISDRQYSFIFRQGAFEDLGNQMKNAIKVVPRTIYVDKPVRQKGDGKKNVWFIVGAVVGAALGITGATVLR